MITRALQLVPQRCPASASQMCIIDTASRGSAGCGDPVGRPTVIAVKTPSRSGSRNKAAKLRNRRKITRRFLVSGMLVWYRRDGGYTGDAGGEVRDDLPAPG